MGAVQEAWQPPHVGLELSGGIDPFSRAPHTFCSLGPKGHLRV